MDAASAVDGYLAALGAPHRRVAAGEWGLTLADVGGWPLDVGVALRDGLVRVQAEVAGPGQLDPHWLLHRNRRIALVRFAETQAGAVWIAGELPEAAVDEGQLDRLLGSLVRAADEARAAAGEPKGI